MIVSEVSQSGSTAILFVKKFACDALEVNLLHAGCEACQPNPLQASQEDEGRGTSIPTQ